MDGCWPACSKDSHAMCCPNRIRDSSGKCNDEEGCLLGLLHEQDGVLLVTKFQRKHMGKRDLELVDWFDFCPHCGVKCD